MEQNLVSGEILKVTLTIHSGEHLRHCGVLFRRPHPHCPHICSGQCAVAIHTVSDQPAMSDQYAMSDQFAMSDQYAMSDQSVMSD